jgi:uncharacterized damage-inducible protein DinB/predicted RNase H-like HicB family nuclease
MAHYSVFLEIADDGRCMAHVPDLPGCITRELTRDRALRRLPDAIRDYYAWLRRHGEPAPPVDEPIEIEIAGESRGFGPFDPRSAAALFPPDREPVTPDEMEYHLRLLTHTRADLLALVGDLSDEILDWQPSAESFSLRRLMRHVGNAEEWYVSRLVSPETLPPEWEHDKDMPVFEFLDMERRTALARLRQLTAKERSEVHYPTAWAYQPGEPWTARKALRRFLEHEREHTAQVREILSAWRRRLLAHLAAERSEFTAQFIGLDERVLLEWPVIDDWTVRDVLAHVAAWDQLFAERVELILAGREHEMAGVDLDERNAALHIEHQGWSLERALAACVKARADFLAALAQLSDEDFHRRRRFSWGEASVRQWTGWRAMHDASHASELAAWREARSLGSNVGLHEILLAGLTAAREELLTAAALVPPQERTLRPVCGEWTLKDVLGHVADWEWLGVEGLRHMAAGDAPQVEQVTDVDAWNRDHAETRRGQPWERVWDDLHGARRALLEVLGGLGQAGLARSFPMSWGSEITPYGWIRAYLSHDRSHARDLRELEL